MFISYLITQMMFYAAKGCEKALSSPTRRMTEEEKRADFERRWREIAHHDSMTDIDPVTGDYTKKGTSLRFDKYGVMKCSR